MLGAGLTLRTVEVTSARDSRTSVGPIIDRFETLVPGGEEGTGPRAATLNRGDALKRLG